MNPKGRYPYRQDSTGGARAEFERPRQPRSPSERKRENGKPERQSPCDRLFSLR